VKRRFKITLRMSFAEGSRGYNAWRMAHDDTKLALDTRRLDVYLTSVQAEVEAKVRLVHRFREHMQQIDAGPSGRRNQDQRKHAARAMIAQVDGMLQTNLLVRDMLEELREAAEAVLSDLTAGD
jgi:hypothetical protein